MNRYGRLARDHWKSTDPSRYSQIQDPHEFFSDLGETVESRSRTCGCSWPARTR